MRELLSECDKRQIPWHSMTANQFRKVMVDLTGADIPENIEFESGAQTFLDALRK